MIRTLAIAVALAAAPMAYAQTPSAVSGYRLDGSAFNLPADLQGAPTLLIVQNYGPDEAQAKPWREAAARLDLRHLTVVVMGARDRLGRVTGAGRLRADVDDVSLRAFIAPVFHEAVVVREALGLPRSAGATQVILTDRQGSFVASVDEPQDLEKSTALAARPPPSARSPEASAPSVARQSPVSPPQFPPALTAATPSVSPTLSARTTPHESARADPLVGLTLAGQRRRVPEDAGRIVIAANADHVAEVLARLANLNKSGDCARGCLGVVAMGEGPRPTRAIAAGRLRALVEEESVRALIVPMYISAAELFDRLGVVQDAPIAEVVSP